MVINLDMLVISIIVNIIIVAPVLWLAGRALVGKEKAKFTDAIWIVVLGTVIGTSSTAGGLERWQLVYWQ